MTITTSNGIDWPIYYADTVRIGNPDSDTALICLWTKKTHVDTVVNDDHYALLGQLYSQSYGIEILCRNLLANNKIRYLVVTGIDLNDVSPGLINLFEYGLNPDNTIPGTNIEVSDDLAEHLDVLTDRVTLVDERRSNDFDDLNETLRSLPSLDPTGQEVILDLPDVVQPTRFPTDFAGFRVRGRTVTEAWYQLLRRILLFGEYDPETEELKAINISAHAKTIDEDDPALIDAVPPVQTNPSKKRIDGVEHTMIHRDRVEAWEDFRGIIADNEPPITVSINEAYLDEPDIKKAIEATAPRGKHDRNPDPHGNILIRIEDNAVKILHCNQRGEVIDEHEGTQKDELFHHIESSYKVSLIDHALDVGAEIQKAITALNNDGVSYEQDRPLSIPSQRPQP